MLQILDKPTIMVTLDTSTTETGYAIWRNGELKRYSTIKGDMAINDITKRVNQMIKEILNLIEPLDPDIVIIEGLTVFNDIKTDSNLSDIIGAVRGICAYRGIFFDKLFPNEWRGLIADDNEKIPTKRTDCKPWDIEKVKTLFNIITDNDNIADAVLIGLAYKILINKYGTTLTEGEEL